MAPSFSFAAGLNFWWAEKLSVISVDVALRASDKHRLSNCFDHAQAVIHSHSDCCDVKHRVVKIDLPWLKRYSLTDLASNNSKTCCLPRCQRLKLIS